MAEQTLNKRRLMAIIGVATLSSTGFMLAWPTIQKFLPALNFGFLPAEDPGREEIKALKDLAAQQRREKLMAVVQNGKPMERDQAKFLLAMDLIKDYEGGQALDYLDNLEQSYPVLAPHILLLRGRGQELTNNIDGAKVTWQQLMASYPDSPIIAEALIYLSKYDQTHWQRAVKDYPYHPAVQNLAQTKLQENPDQFDLLLLLARQNPTDPGSNRIRDRLREKFPDQLTQEDWAMVGDGYWQTFLYEQAAEAYAKAKPTPENLYRHARSLHVSDRGTEAIPVYKRLIGAFPDAEDGIRARQRMALLLPPQAAIEQLNQIINNYAQFAPEALEQKAKLLEGQGDLKNSAKTWQQLLDQYPKSEANAKYRWRKALEANAKQDWKTAWLWSQPILENHLDGDLTAKAGFWIGKWATKLNRPEDAAQYFLYTAKAYPHSYYAWRSLVMLGYGEQVGDFTTLKSLQPKIEKPSGSFTPLVGSEAFRELYQLGEITEASKLFEAQLNFQDTINVDEQFTDAVLKIHKGKYLGAINQIWQLGQREEPEAKKRWQELRTEPFYWETLFAMPYQDLIETWSAQRDLNPLLVMGLIRQESRFEKDIVPRWEL
ncbi:MAG: tetratricopeptide repeat protein [Synechococcaceae cyanobacterium RL_1_2]|nr:tetratricopeptide repeat protein [Synechococcaceae cyanobacterium RL_1_2]